MKKRHENPLKSWSVAPLPRFPDLEFATALVREKLYPSIDDAYIEVNQEKKDFVHARCAQYLENYRYPRCWRIAQLPRHS